jgi:adenosine deaminase
MSLSSVETVVDERTIRALPKAEVHVHLEGSFALADLLELAHEAGVPLPGPAATLFDVGTHAAQQDQHLGSAGLSTFLRFLDWECGLIRTSAQAARAAYRFAAHQSASGIRYTDVIINPTHWARWASRLPALFDALAAGFDDAEQDGLCVVRMAVSLLRTQTAGEARELVDWLVTDRPRHVVALSVDGNESASGRTGEKFAEAFTMARDGGLHRTVHAGESSGPEGVWDALTLLHAERIDHGVRSIEDPRLIDRLVESGTPLGVCTSSNITLGLYPSLREHPVNALRAAGVTVTLNTDDPAPIGTRLEREWAAAATVFGWDDAVMRELARASIVASFAEPEFVSRLLSELDAA